jgi:hypothetical protein
MAAVNEILFGASVAAVRKDNSLRVYESDVNGNIRECQYENEWTGGTSSNIIASGRINTPVAACNLGLETIRVYYVGHDCKAHEACYDEGRGWNNGGFGFDVAPYTNLAAIFLSKTDTLRVYGQKADNSIQEWCCAWFLCFLSVFADGFLCMVRFGGAYFESR